MKIKIVFLVIVFFTNKCFGESWRLDTTMSIKIRNVSDFVILDFPYLHFHFTELYKKVDKDIYCLQGYVDEFSDEILIDTTFSCSIFNVNNEFVIGTKLFMQNGFFSLFFKEGEYVILDFGHEEKYKIELILK